MSGFTPDTAMELWLQGDASSVPEARGASHLFIEKAGAPWSIIEDDVALVVSELVSNACRHAPGPCRVRLRTTGCETCIVEVWDTSSCLEDVVVRTETMEPDVSLPCGGYGLGIVACLSHEVQVQREQSGKTVQAVLNAPGQP
ncbi:ATP-binding protein [Streptomyces sp. NPDC051133]|uniref:ATP-binding protein n=1 Tax=Streptomyces sp. NPDC051133 TaxID=3155521 RepID=UPI003447F69B